jgi:hypothetical protein
MIDCGDPNAWWYVWSLGVLCGTALVAVGFLLTEALRRW